MKRALAILLSLCVVLSLLPTALAAEAVGSDFASALAERYAEPEREYHTEVRWWMPAGYHTDETIKEELQAIYDAGFRGVELTLRMGDAENVNEKIYGYGSDQWDHDFRLILNTCLDLGMTLGVTSGAMSATANVPGLDPQSQAANQCVVQVEETVAAGKTRSGAITIDSTIHSKARFLGAYAWRKSLDPIHSSDTRYNMTDELNSDLLNYTIETDLVLEKQASGFCFGVKDNNNFIMWQINAVDQAGKVLCKPHVRYNNGSSTAWYGRETHDVTAAIGYNDTEILGKTVHMKLVVTDGTNIKTYFNGSETPAFDYDLPVETTGKWAMGDLMFRQATTSNGKSEELARYDNVVVTDAEGKEIYRNTFDDPENPGFAGKNLKVVDGMLRVGVDQVPATVANTIDASTIVDLTDKVVLNDDGRTGTLEWTAPSDGSYTIMCYWQQGTSDRWSPCAIDSYTVNYMDTRGVEALKAYWEANILNDEALNKKIKESGAVQLFMDSLEYRTGRGFSLWPEGFEDEFKARKGYDIRPYLFLSIGLPTLWSWQANSDIQGTYKLTDADLQQRVMNDFYDVQTELYMENFMIPLRQWLNSCGIKLRAQISYGKYLELSEPINVVDFPEAETRVQGNEPDLYRTWTGGAHLQNKILSSETGAPTLSRYFYTHQRHTQEAYMQYAVGFSREIWHSWVAPYGGTAEWPGYEVGSPSYYKLGTREPSYTEFVEFNDHLGRVQQLLREGKAGVDVGMPYIQYGQRLTLNKNDKALTHTPMFFPSEELQNNGYTYDYFAPNLLKADGVYYDRENGTLELAGYKAIVLWQDEMTLEGAQYLLDYAKQGLKVVVVDGAAVATPYNDGSDEAMLAVMAELKQLENVVCVASAEDVLEALQTMGVEPYAGYAAPNQQLLSQTRRDGENRFLYLYNYCDEILHESTHGTTVTTEVIVDGLYQPYKIDAWSGEVTGVGEYRQENGKTVFEVTLDYGDVALYAFEPEQGAVHIVDTELPSYEKNGDLFVRATENVETTVTLSNGVQRTLSAEVPEAYEITGWDLTVESWTPGEKISRTQTVNGVATTEYAISTNKTNVSVHLEELKTWDNIPEVGKTVSGKGVYTAKFNWDGEADGAYLDFGPMIESMEIYINGKQTADLNMNVPVLDISDELVEGENTIELRYSSNLTNVQLSLGNITEGPLSHKWAGYSVYYRAYGPSQAVVIPYVDMQVLEPVVDVTLSLSAEEETHVYAEDIAYTVSAQDMMRLASVLIELDLDETCVTDPVAEPAEGWYVVAQSWEDGLFRVALANNEGANGDGELMTVHTTPTGNPGEAAAAITQVQLGAYDGSKETFVNAIYGDAKVVTVVNYSRFDVNKDGVVDLLDITYSQRCYGRPDPLADITGDGLVDIRDMILILNNFTDLFQ